MQSYVTVAQIIHLPSPLSSPYPSFEHKLARAFPVSDLLHESPHPALAPGLPALSAPSLIWVPSFAVTDSAPKPQHHIWLERNTENAGFCLLTSTTVLFAIHIPRAMSTYLPKYKNAF